MHFLYCYPSTYIMGYCIAQLVGMMKNGLFILSKNEGKWSIKLSDIKLNGEYFVIVQLDFQ